LHDYKNPKLEFHKKQSAWWNAISFHAPESEILVSNAGWSSNKKGR
jgi:hypothetical protein